MIEVYEVSRKYYSCITTDTGLLTYFVLPEKKHREIFEIFKKYFTPKNFTKFYITIRMNAPCRMVHCSYTVER